MKISSAAAPRRSTGRRVGAVEDPGQQPLPPPALSPGTRPPTADVPDRPAPPPAPTWSTSPSVRVGDLTATWRILLGLAWTAGFFAYAAVWQASVQLGIGTWWIGPRADPTPTLLRLVPFLVCLAMILCVVYGLRRLPTIGVTLGLGLAAFAIPDLTRSTSLAVTELVVAALLVIVSASARTGLVRPAEPASSDRLATVAEPLPEPSVDGR